MSGLFKPFKTVAQPSALLLALMLLTLPASPMHAQTAVSSMDAVTGGDPQPTGEPKPHVIRAIPDALISALILLHLA